MGKSGLRPLWHSGSVVNIFWILYALAATHWCLGKEGGDTDMALCRSKGALPAPELFLNATSIAEGSWISVLCINTANTSMTRFFFCRDGSPISTQKAKTSFAVHNIHIAQHIAGQYYCGYEQKDNNNQEVSAFSASQALPGKHDESTERTNCTDQQWAIISGVIGFAIPISIYLIYLSRKKVASFWKQEGTSAQPDLRDYVEETPVIDSRSHGIFVEMQYDEIANFSQTVFPSCHYPKNAERTTYVTIAPLSGKHALEISSTPDSNGVPPEGMSSYGVK